MIEIFDDFNIGELSFEGVSSCNQNTKNMKYKQLIF